MGVPFLFAWLRKRYPQVVIPVKKGALIETPPIDVLCIDLNSIIHNACQIVYEYGNGEKLSTFHRQPPRNPFQLQKRAYERVSSEIEKILDMVQPRKSLVLCIDGPACISKQAQQRSRRARAAKERKEDAVFDSTSITPGTEWLDGLSRYLDAHIRYQIGALASWGKLEVIFASEKVPGEGEHGLIRYIRSLDDKSLTYVIHGLDADLIMLALGTQCPHFYVLREDQFSCNLIDVGALRLELCLVLDTTIQKNMDRVIDDFVFLCFLLGNDFLPHSPSLEILQGGIDVLCDSYSVVGKHIITRQKGGVTFDPEVLKEILVLIGKDEAERVALRAEDSTFVKDPLYDKDFDKYRHNYYQEHFKKGAIEIEDEKEVLIDMKYIVHSFLDGMNWVINYYLYGIPSWTWTYPYLYSPFIKEIVTYISDWKPKPFAMGQPCTPFLQLVYVLPPQSKNLLPPPLDTIVAKKDTSFTIDMAGKRFDWQAVIVLPDQDLGSLEREYSALVSRVDEKHLKRNCLGKARIYTQKKGRPYLYNSLYGKFNCYADVKEIDL
jgi:5'-3' exoribonuclease 1